MLLDKNFHGFSDWVWFETLQSCMHVCRAWYSRARRNLYTHAVITKRPIDLPSFDRALNKQDSSNLTELFIGRGVPYSPASAFCIKHRMPNLRRLFLDEFNISREHSLFYRSPLFYSVQTLAINFEQECQSSQLIRLLNAFPSLSSLSIIFGDEGLGYNGQVLPRAAFKSTRSLSSLYLDLKRGTFRLIHWLIKAKLLVHLRNLILRCDASNGIVELQSHLKGVDRLIRNCCSSVEDLTLELHYMPTSNSIEHISMSALFSPPPYPTLILTRPICFSPTEEFFELTKIDVHRGGY